MPVAITTHDSTDCGRPQLQVARDVALAHSILRKFPNIRNKVFGDLAVGSVRRLCAMFATTAAVFGVGFIAEIAQCIIAAISVEMRGLHAVRHSSDERFQYQPMNGKHLALPIRAKVRSEIAVALADGLQNVATVIAEDASLIRNKVNALISDHGFERLEHAAEYHIMRRVTRFGQVGRVYVCPDMLKAA